MKRSGLSGQRSKLEAIPGFARREDVPGERGLVLELAAQLSDVRIDGAGYRRVGVAPDPAQELEPRHDGASPHPQRDEQVELLGGEIDRHPPLRHRPRAAMDFDVSESNG